MRLKYWKLFLTMPLLLVLSCTTGIKEYRGIKTEIESLRDQAIHQKMSSEEAAEKIARLQKELTTFNVDIIEQYEEEQILKNKRNNSKKMNELLVQSKVKRETDLPMIRSNEFREKDLFLVEFDKKEYEVSINQWKAWKESKMQVHKKAIDEANMLRAALSPSELQNITKSIYRAILNEIKTGKISMKTVEGIQLYDILRTGEAKFE